MHVLSRKWIFRKYVTWCSLILNFHTTNAKPYIRRAILALEINKPDLVFIDLAQALKIDPNNGEFQKKKNQ